MRRIVPATIQQVYIADGFADDCDELIHRCSRVDILSYQTFCIYYKDMNFASMFKGRTSNAEIAELSEELLQIAKYYMVLDTSNFEESVAGLFLVYALLNLQPYPGFAPLRIVPDDLPAISRIEQVARRERRLDVLYVLGSVLTKGPVQYHAASRERGMEGAIRKYLEGSCSIDVTGVRPKGVYFRQNEELDIIREMTSIFKRYSKAKEQIPGLKQRGLSYCNDNLADDLGTSLKRLINGIIDEAEAEPASHYSAVQEIKRRAMRGAVATVRHLNAADQRSPEKNPHSSNGTSSTPKRPIPQSPSTARKRSPKAKTKTVKPKRTKTLSGSPSSSASSSPNDDFDDDEWSKRRRSPASSFLDEEANVEAKSDEQEISVEIDRLPSLITTESEGKVVEIEIIDKMEKRARPKKILDLNVNEDSEEKQEVEVNKKQSEPKKKEIEKEKNIEKKKKDTGATKNDDAIFKKPLRMSPRLRKLAKREMKKTIMKSKFKKMGMLPIANFEEQK